MSRIPTATGSRNEYYVGASAKKQQFDPQKARAVSAATVRK
jgi:hypothetical protein|tara:strand:- start:6 stop:128 length:123 start_codon:yes stop_codon:yes gene_type:complete